MQRCSFYILPSRHETFGNVLVEAMACGKAVVATRCGGPEEILTKEVGLLCEKENTRDLAEKIKVMIHGHKNYSEYDVQHYVSTKFSLITFSDLLKNLYSSIN